MKWLLRLLAVFFLFYVAFIVFSPTPLQEAAAPQREGPPGYLTLNREEQKLYQQILAVIEAREDRIALGTGIDRDLFFKIWEYIRWDKPELFWLSSRCQVYHGDDENTLVSARFFYTYPKEEVAAMRWELEQRVQEAVVAAKESHDPLRALHDFLVDSVRYHAGGNNAYSAIVLGKGNCFGYAKAFQLLANRCGYRCYIATGTGRNNSHSWNVIQGLNGPLYIDVTWDDPLLQKGQLLTPQVRYRYFLIDEKTLLQDHSPPDAPPYGYPLPTIENR